MNEKAKNQIEAMKKQTFGVEIEMYNISRDHVAQVVAGFYHQENTINYRGGAYRAWECRDDKGRTWKVAWDSSIIAACEDEHSELVTPILTYEDLPDLCEIVRRLRRAGAKSDPSHMCGVHIHIGLGNHTAQSLRNLANIMAAREQLLISALRLDRARIRQYCRTVDPAFLRRLNAARPKTMEALKKIWYKTLAPYDRETAHYNPSRYHILNLHASFTKGTIEFRCFQFANPDGERQNGLHAGELKTYIQLCLAMSQLAKMVKTASPRQPQIENPKYAMRTWLLRLGFIGDEFATARMILTRNLEGDTAFRHGRAA